MLKVAKKINNHFIKIESNILYNFTGKLLSNANLQNNLVVSKYLTLKFFQKKSSFYSFSKYRNFCLLTGRTRSIYKIFRLSRIKLREYSNKGNFLGFSKAS